MRQNLQKPKGRYFSLKGLFLLLIILSFVGCESPNEGDEVKTSFSFESDISDVWSSATRGYLPHRHNVSVAITEFDNSTVEELNKESTIFKYHTHVLSLSPSEIDSLTNGSAIARQLSYTSSHRHDIILDIFDSKY